MSTRLQSLLELADELSEDRVALQCGKQTWSYADLDRQVGQVSQGLRSKGVSPGDRVAWFLPNCIEAVLTTLACYRLGAIAVPLNYRYVPEEILDVVSRTRSHCLIYSDAKRALVESLLPQCENLLTINAAAGATESTTPYQFAELLEQPALDAAEQVAEDHPALILFTSGSTGHPKGVVHSHASTLASIEVSRNTFAFEKSDVLLVGKPISHAGGLQTQLMAGLYAGARNVLAMRPTPAEATALIRQEGVTEYGLLASDLLDFIEYLEAHPTPLPSLKNCIGSGDAVPRDLHQRFQALLGWEVMEGAGMTEIAGYYAANPRFGVRKWGSLGLPTDRTKLKIVDPDMQTRAAGEVGEIVLQTPSATIGYWENQQATDELFQDGWLHTGDLAFADEDGYIWFVARAKLMIVRRGSNIAPAEIESILDQHSAVHASVVVGMSDAHEGQVPVACVSLLKSSQDTASIEQSLREFCSEHLAAYKNPVHYMFLEQLPTNSTGKYARHELEQLVVASLGHSPNP